MRGLAGRRGKAEREEGLRGVRVSLEDFDIEHARGWVVRGDRVEGEEGAGLADEEVDGC